MEQVRDEPSKTDRLATMIRDAIRQGELAQGALYSAQELAERFNVSRTPVREALLRLADAGLVSIQRNRGVRVRTNTEHDIAEILTLRLLLEPPATRRAAQRLTDTGREELSAALARMRADVGDLDAFFAADRAFHDVVLRESGNERLASYVTGLRDALSLHGRRSIPTVRSPEQVIAEHTEIAEAVLSGDATAAEAAMRTHLLSTAALLSSPHSTADPEWLTWLPQVD